MFFNSEMTQWPNTPSRSVPGGQFHCAGLKSDIIPLPASKNSKIKYVTLTHHAEEKLVGFVSVPTLLVEAQIHITFCLLNTSPVSLAGKLQTEPPRKLPSH